MTFIEPGWLGLPALIIIVVATALVATAILYGLVPPARRFIRGERPVWWVRDGFLAVFVAVLVLFGHSYVFGAGDTGENQGPEEGLAQRISYLDFVRFRSSEQYQARPFRRFDLSGMNIAGLELAGADFTGANLSGADLTGTTIRNQPATPEVPGPQGQAPIPGSPGAKALLSGVNLCHADLTGADLRYSYLIYANLNGVDLTFTQLQGAALNGSDLSAATLPADPGGLEGVYYDDDTIWPEGFEPPPSATGNKLDFLKRPLDSKLYADVQRPECDS